MAHRDCGYLDLMGDAYYIHHFRPSTYNCYPQAIANNLINLNGNFFMDFTSLERGSTWDVSIS